MNLPDFHPHRTRRHASAVLAAVVATFMATLLPAAAAQPEARVSMVSLPARTSVDDIRIAELSGLAWDADDQRLYAVSDRGNLFAFTVQRNGNDLEAVKPVSATPLDASVNDGDPPDAEGLAAVNGNDGHAGNTALVVALEGDTPRIVRFDTSGKALNEIRVPPPASDVDAYGKRKRGLEAVALMPGFGVVTAPESPLEDAPDDHHVLYANGHHWAFKRIAPKSRLKGLAVLPNGDILTLERSKVRVDSNKLKVATVRRITPVDCRAGSCRAPVVISLPPSDDNFEGMAVLDAHHILLVSDNGKGKRPTVFALVTLP